MYTLFNLHSASNRIKIKFHKFIHSHIPLKNTSHIVIVKIHKVIICSKIINSIHTSSDDNEYIVFAYVCTTWAYEYAPHIPAHSHEKYVPFFLCIKFFIRKNSVI